MRIGDCGGLLVLVTMTFGIWGTSPANSRGSSNIARGREPQAGCPVRGVWDLVSRTIDGKDSPLNGFRERKIVTARHYMWVAHAGKRDTLPFNTELEQLRAMHFEGGAGTYTMSDSTYTEHIELYDNAREIGTSFVAKCRVTGDRWEHIFTIPNDTTKASGQVLHFVQVYRRIG